MKLSLQNLRSYWPLGLALIFCAYSWTLLFSVLQTQGQLRHEAEQHSISDSQQKARALADLLAEFRLGAGVLAEAPEISYYLTNRSLGMSLRYGLGTSIYDIQERFIRQAREMTHRGHPLFSRIAFIDENGTSVADTGSTHVDDGGIGISCARRGVDVESSRLGVCVPVQFKGGDAGRVIAVGDTSALFADLERRQGSLRHYELLVDRQGLELVADGQERLLAADAAKSLRNLSPEHLTPLSLAVAGGEVDEWLAVAVPVSGRDLLLVSLFSQESVYGQATSRAAIYAAAIFPLAAIVVALMFLRMRRAVAALAQSRKRFQTVFDHISDAILIVTVDDARIVEVNPRMLAMFGYHREEIGLLSMADLSEGCDEYGGVRWLELQSGVCGGQTSVFNWRARARDGRLFWVDISILRTQIDGVERMLVVAHDIEQRKRQEEELRAALEYQKQLNHKLEEAQGQLLQSEKMASIGQLAAGVAHEINNPIGFINSNIGTLQGYVRDLFALLATYEGAIGRLPHGPADVAEIEQTRKAIDLPFLQEDMPSLMAETQEGVRRVRKIVQDMKDFSHVDSNEWQMADLHGGLESTLNVVWNELKYKAEVVREYGDIPEVECLPGQINQVLMNLLINAAHAISERGRITLRSGQADGMVWVEVEDNGQGIAPEHLARIFDPFFTTKPVGKGTGLGLSLAYGIVKKHDGRIEVDSEPGRGSRFRIYLPVRHEAEAA